MDGSTHPHRDGRHRSGGRPVFPFSRPGILLHRLPAFPAIGVLIDAARREMGGLLRERYAHGEIEREDLGWRRGRHGP